MSTRLLYFPDFHKRDTSFSTIRGYVDAHDACQLDLLKLIDELKVDKLLLGGDWYDKGYRSTGRTYNDANFDSAISNAVNGEAYICLGNHLYIERDENPEIYMIQPSNVARPLKSIYAEKPTFKAVWGLQIGTVYISFFHFDKENKEYINSLSPDITYHIALYHDDKLLPSAYREQAGYFGTTSQGYLNRVLSNVDLALLGHVHTSIGVININVNDRVVPMIVPGAACVTKNSGVDKHKSIQLPIIDIDDDNHVKISFIEFNIHLEMLEFADKEHIVKGNTAFDEDGQVRKQAKDMFMANPDASTIRQYIQDRGYPKQYITLLDNAMPGNLDFMKVRDILHGEDSNTVNKGETGRTDSEEVSVGAVV